MKEIYKELSQKLFDLFVVNNKAIAIQQLNSKYYAKYFSYDYTLFQEMLIHHGSLGCYQEDLNSKRLKWICLDFDCKEKYDNNIPELFSYIDSTLLSSLRELSISYLTEFSGRRGIHVWIIFDSFISKQLGYQIINKIWQITNLDNKYGLDLFPKTDIPAKKVGLAVKLPLSCHTDGGQSYFFENTFSEEDINSEKFLESQLKILNNYQLNNVNNICKILDVSDTEIWNNTKYKKITIINNIDITSNEIINILSEIPIFQDIFHRLFNSIPLDKDWYVLLGTLSPLDPEGLLLDTIFSNSSKYVKKITFEKIKQWKDKYYPATIDFLYKLYNKNLDCNIDIHITALEYLIKRINDTKGSQITYKVKDLDVTNNFDLQTIIQKEKHYIIDNDEKIIIPLWNDINTISNIDINRINQIINNLDLEYNYPYLNKTNYCIERKEDSEKTRYLIVLNLWDRLITTTLALRIAEKLNTNLEKTETFSYKIDPLSRTSIFKNWYNQWSRYIDRIKTYLEIPFFKRYGVFMIDIRHFYDSVDFVYVKKALELKTEYSNELKYLVTYTERLMNSIFHRRIGLPQGPAYARIIAEFFLDCVISEFEKNNKEKKFQIYRYVDDIIVFYENLNEGDILYKSLSNLLLKNGLAPNSEKSKNFGLIENLTQDDKKMLLHKNKFNYLLQDSDYSKLLSESEKKSFFDQYLKGDFDINKCSFVFSNKTEKYYQNKFYQEYAQRIFLSDIGRGSIFYRFYNYLFRNPQLLEEAIEKKSFDLIDKKSLNFQIFISTLYLSVQSEIINIEQLYIICNEFLAKYKKLELGAEELFIIEALCKKYGKYK